MSDAIAHAKRGALYPERLDGSNTPEQAQYFRHGFCKFDSLAPQDALAAAIKAYRECLLPFEGGILRHNNRLEPHVLRNGHFTMPLLNPHDPTQTPGLESFALAVCNLLTCAPVRSALESLSGQPMRLEQSLFYDHCPEPISIPHQDGIYLDSIPFGHMVCIWIALEDIPADAGALFFLPWEYTPVTPDEQKHLTIEEVFHTSQYKDAMWRMIDPLREYFVTPPMRRGDVLMWNSRIIHGGTEPQNRARSRMNVAGHYIPTAMKAGTVFGDEYVVPMVMANGMPVRSGRILAKNEPPRPQNTKKPGA